MEIPYRLRQFIYYARSNRNCPPEIPEDAREMLTDSMEDQFRTLSSGDQRHLLCVFQRLKSTGAHEDVVIAGLLHDIGKACCTRQITLLDRCAHVFLNKYIPVPYRLFARGKAVPAGLLGLQRLATHATRGAIAARQAGYNRRVCWLIEHHDRRDSISDPDLLMLRTADDVAESMYELA